MKIGENVSRKINDSISYQDTGSIRYKVFHLVNESIYKSYDDLVRENMLLMVVQSVSNRYLIQGLILSDFNQISGQTWKLGNT